MDIPGFCIFGYHTHVIRVDPSFFFFFGGGLVGWLLHDDWNHANVLELLPK